MKKTPKYKIINKRRFTAFCTALALVVFGAVYSVSAAATKAKASEREYIVVCVGAGDTLWSIAKENCGDDADIRGAVSDIKAANGMRSSTIHPGDMLYVPVY